MSFDNSKFNPADPLNFSRQFNYLDKLANSEIEGTKKLGDWGKMIPVNENSHLTQTNVNRPF